MTDRKPPTVPLYVRIPVDLRLRLDALASGSVIGNTWRRGRLQDLIIEALYRAFPPIPPRPTPTPDPPEPEPEPPTPPRPRTRRTPKTKASKSRKATRIETLRNIAA